VKPAEHYVLKQEEPFRSILLQLQTIVEVLPPNAQLLFAWCIPFYYCNGIPLCYFNQSKNYVDLVFWHGKKLDNYREDFVTINRKSVSSLRYKSLEDIDDAFIIYVIKQENKINTNPFALTRKSKTQLSIFVLPPN
jgi:hypothetical protein